MLGCSFFKYFSGLNLLITLGVSLTAWCSDEIVLTVYLEQKCNTPNIKTVKLIKAKPFRADFERYIFQRSVCRGTFSRVTIILFEFCGKSSPLKHLWS